MRLLLSAACVWAVLIFGNIIHAQVTESFNITYAGTVYPGVVNLTVGSGVLSWELAPGYAFSVLNYSGFGGGGTISGVYVGATSAAGSYLVYIYANSSGSPPSFLPPNYVGTSFTVTWAGGSSTPSVAGPAIALDQRKITFSWTNPTGINQEVGILQFTSAGVPTGIMFNQQMVAPGVNVQVPWMLSSSDGYLYAIGAEDYAATWALYGGPPINGTIYELNAAGQPDGTILGSDLQGVVAIAGYTTPEGYSSGSPVYTVTSGTQDGPGTSDQVPVVIPPITTAPPATTTPTPVTVGPGGSTASTDAGTASAITSLSSTVTNALGSLAGTLSTGGIAQQNATSNGDAAIVNAIDSNVDGQGAAVVNEASTFASGLSAAETSQGSAASTAATTSATGVHSLVAAIGAPDSSVDQVTWPAGTPAAHMQGIQGVDGTDFSLTSVDVNVLTSPIVDHFYPIHDLMTLGYDGALWLAQYLFVMWLYRRISDGLSAVIMSPSTGAGSLEGAADGNAITAALGPAVSLVAIAAFGAVIVAGVSIVISCYSTVAPLAAARATAALINSAFGGSVSAMVQYASCVVPLPGLCAISFNYFAAEAAFMFGVPGAQTLVRLFRL